MFRESLKWVLLGGLSATALSIGVYLGVPVSAELEDVTVEEEDVDYVRSLYGVPVMDMEHYKLSSDKYLKYILDGYLSVGRSNPSSYTVWYKTLLDNPDKLNTDSELREKVFRALGESQFNELEEVIKKMEEEKRLAEEEAERQAEEEDKEDKEDKDEKEDKVDGEDKEDNRVLPDNFKAVDYIKSFDKEIESLKSYTEEDLSDSEWKEIKKSSMDYSLKVSNSLVRDAKDLSEEVNKDFSKNMIYLNDKFIDFINVVDNGSEDEIVKVIDEIDKIVSNLKKELE